ncbi:MAG: GNAT family N-acetyltransferase [Eubacteriales bacterium]|nr:GNAT family N-acetyltransferase [Christensenellaceae bacterium]MEA5067012.1 GNAT family N-acetyltransferase [Eubacteriales bacterium]
MIYENTPAVETPRLILRRFAEGDVGDFLAIMSDPEANTFLPWFALTTLAEAEAFLAERYLSHYDRPSAYRYAICLKEDDRPVGYVNLSDGESHDFGYGLRADCWHRGIVTEAAAAVVERIRRAGLPFITATHDVNNPRSGAVMKKLGMVYRYSYVEQWQPKDISVTFRMYQMNFDEGDRSVYRGYWKRYGEHFVEPGV